MTAPTTLHHVRAVVSDIIGMIPEAVHELTPLPKHDLGARRHAECQRCRLTEAILGNPWTLELDGCATVGELVRHIEAREAQVRG